MRSLLVATVSLLSFLVAVPQCRPVLAEQPADVVALLKSPDFWDKAGKKGFREWTAAEQKQLEHLKTTSQTGLLRLRANKVLVDLALHSRYAAEHEPIVAAGFRYLESRLTEAPLQKLCTDQGFTHYSVSTKSDSSLLFLIEHAQAGGFNGGLNLTWDTKKKTIADIQSWGAVPPL